MCLKRTAKICEETRPLIVKSMLELAILRDKAAKAAAYADNAWKFLQTANWEPPAPSAPPAKLDLPVVKPDRWLARRSQESRRLAAKVREPRVRRAILAGVQDFKAVAEL